MWGHRRRAPAATLTPARLRRSFLASAARSPLPIMEEGYFFTWQLLAGCFLSPSREEAAFYDSGGEIVAWVRSQSSARAFQRKGKKEAR